MLNCPQEKDDGGGLSAGAIVGISLAGVAGVTLLALIGVMAHREKQGKPIFTPLVGGTGV